MGNDFTASEKSGSGSLSKMDTLKWEDELTDRGIKRMKTNCSTMSEMMELSGESSASSSFAIWFASWKHIPLFQIKPQSFNQGFRIAIDFKQEFRDVKDSPMNSSYFFYKKTILSVIRQILSRSSQAQLGENLRALVQKLRAPPYISNCSIIIPKKWLTYRLSRLKTLPGFLCICWDCRSPL